MGVRHRVGSLVLRRGVDFVEKDPQKNLPKVVNFIERLDVRRQFRSTTSYVREILDDDENNWNLMIKNTLRDIDTEVLKKFLVNFIFNSGIVSGRLAERARRKYNCNIPWAVLMDPTAACNLGCMGCWASEYDKTASMDYETLDRIITEGKELGVYMYIYSGGEPLMRKEDLIRLAEKHADCAFLSFTNATLVDEEFAKELRRVANFALAISIEGFEEETDMRRGKGAYQKVMRAMDILREHKVPFGFSTCYHRYNTETVGSEEYIDLMVEKGCKFAWYFTYMPLGKNAVTDLLVEPEQRAFMYRQVRKFRETKPIFALDFWNDGEYVNGCIAGGRSYLHINANGDVEPCAFIHYANVNINEVSLVEALRSPLFMEYRKHAPFNENHLRPCPLLDNPEILKKMVNDSKAHSTQPIDEESVEELTDKCQEISRRWAVTADCLWEKSGAACSKKAPQVS